MNKLIPWSERIKGARDMLWALNNRGYLNTTNAPKTDRWDKVTRTAIIQLMLDDKTNIDRFLNEDEIVFYDWGKDKKGKPIKCKAKFK